MYYVQQALAMWEPRIEVKRVKVAPDPTDGSRMLIEIEYQVKATYDSRALVFPVLSHPGRRFGHRLSGGRVH